MLWVWSVCYDLSRAGNNNGSDKKMNEHTVDRFYKMKSDVYQQLRKFLDSLPTGFPETPSGVELKILKKLFTPEQAALTIQLRNSPEPVKDIAKRTARDPQDLKRELEEMAQQGLIFRVKKEGQPCYQAFQFMIGIYEFQLNHLDREFCELFEEYFPYLGLSLARVKTRQLRVVPVNSAVRTVATVETYNNIKALVKEQTTIAVQDCICSKEQMLLDNSCDKPRETCIGFGDFAQYYIDNQMGRPIDSQEALEILDRAEKHGLVLQPSNTQKLSAICCCCTCCCPILKKAKAYNRPSALIKTYYHAAIDDDLCVACGECVDRCPMDAIENGTAASEVLMDRCIGCGLCVSACPEGAISMVAKPDMVPPPETFEDTFEQIKAERRASAKRR
jgi:ferredoxin